MKLAKNNSINAASGGHLPAMERVLSNAAELGKEISDEYFGYALYRMYCG